jgi:O-Antigen ligase
MRRPVWVLHVFVVGLALHNFVMAELWAAGVRGNTLEVISAWKEALLLLALVAVLRARGSLRFTPTLVDWLAIAFGALVVVYALIPQRVLDGQATHHGVLLASRDYLVPVGAYFLGRGLALRTGELRALGRTIVATAAGLAAFGLIDIYAIPLSWWRHSGAPGWFYYQLGFHYFGLSHLPENFVYNTGNGHPYRRLVSTFLSPLATSYVLVIALLVCAAWWVSLRPRGRALAAWLGSVVLIFAGLLWTHSRASYLALAVGLVAFALVRGTTRDRVTLVLAAVAVVAIGALFVGGYTHFGPKTSFTATELKEQIQHAHEPGAGTAGNGFTDASTASHWQSLRDGVRAVFRHPQGFGPGNASSTAVRTGVPIEAGESTYTQLGADLGLVGALVFVAWALGITWRSLFCVTWVGASFVAVLALGLQTDVVGVPWLAYVLFALGGTSQPDLWRGRPPAP